MKKVFEWAKSKLESINYTNETERIHYQFVFVYFFLTFVSFFMSIINHLTGWHSLEKLTLVYGFLCLICLCIEFFLPENGITSRLIFAISTIIIFSAFAIIGEPEGFSVLWTLLLPTCGFFLFRINYGLIVVLIELAILIFLFWVPLGRSLLLYDYTSTFCLRFPVIYISFLMIGILFEKIRRDTQDELNETRANFERLYNHDMLTLLYNRYGFNSSLDEFIAKRNDKPFAFAILDLDHFKNVNDTYGHQKGDIVLKEAANRIVKTIGDLGICSRWGGEEFSILFKTNADVLDTCNKLMELARTIPIDLGDEKIIVHFSMGLTFIPENVKVDPAKLITTADNNLYNAKETGRNKIVYTIYEED